MNTYAFIKNEKVINTVVFDNPTQELLDTFKNDQQLDSIILASDKAVIGSTWDGVNFILPQPYESWILGEDFYWKPPIEYPQDGMMYEWDESIKNWSFVQ